MEERIERCWGSRRIGVKEVTGERRWREMTNGEEQDREQSRSRRGVKKKSGYGEEHIEEGKYWYLLVLSWIGQGTK